SGSSNEYRRDAPTRRGAVQKRTASARRPASHGRVPGRAAGDARQDCAVAGTPAGSRCREPKATIKQNGPAYAASGASSIGSTIEGSSFSGLLTRLEIGHIRIRPAG